MKLTHFSVEKNDLKVEHKPFVRFSKIGCGIENCNCSPEYFLSISNGSKGISATLTKEEAEMIQKGVADGWISITLEEGK